MTANPATARTEFLEPARTALGRASGELLKIAGVIEELEGFVGDAIKGGTPIGDAHIQELQKLDHAGQMIVAAADFLQALSLDMPPDWRVDVHKAARSVRLAELAGRLGAADPPAVEGHAHASGAYELFD
jgi:hypothetical protein